ncbi:hypothetical protein BCR34DRAFT_93487 [Clohesyomyces aquaticus]|uniref:Uncharacterized protein n=1 Tax=Clohesyomyces aquaticus TaxID=1231657 RepID=A0A1Y2A252_9PLEO|nr:hypothetical protein BCR34DRAFT_93487 [Clohesyomyces aquaticus]
MGLYLSGFWIWNLVFLVKRRSTPRHGPVSRSPQRQPPPGYHTRRAHGRPLSPLVRYPSSTIQSTSHTYLLISGGPYGVSCICIIQPASIGGLSRRSPGLFGESKLFNNKFITSSSSPSSSSSSYNPTPTDIWPPGASPANDYPSSQSAMHNRFSRSCNKTVVIYDMRTDGRHIHLETNPEFRSFENSFPRKLDADNHTTPFTPDAKKPGPSHMRGVYMPERMRYRL